MRVKATYVFEMNGYGWTESHHFETGDASLATSYETALKLGKARQELLAAPGFIKAIRVSDEAVKNDAYLKYVNLPGHAFAGQPENGADMQDTGVLVRLSDNNGKQFKHIFMRGIWDEIDINGGSFIGPLKADWDKAWKAWSKLMLDTPFGWMGVDKTLKKTANITNYTTNGDGQVSFVIDADIFPAPTGTVISEVRVSGLNGGSTLNRQLRVFVTAPNTCVSVDPLGVLPYKSPGKMTFNGAKRFIAAVGASAQKIVTRRAGAPLLDSRGRARKRPVG